MESENLNQQAMKKKVYDIFKCYGCKTTSNSKSYSTYVQRPNKVPKIVTLCELCYMGKNRILTNANYYFCSECLIRRRGSRFVYMREGDLKTMCMDCYYKEVGWTAEE